MLSRRRFISGAAATLLGPAMARRPAAAAAPIVRRDVMEMADDDRFFSDYARAVQKMHDLTGDGRNWLAQAKIHADHCHHGELEFLHWHRHYIRFFEKICANLCGNPGFALPYWNWSKNSGRLPAPFFDRPELNVEHWNDPGQYIATAWGPIDTVGRRGLDKTHGLLDDSARGGAFALETINGIKRLPTIDLFRASLEGQPHNIGHVLTGATKTGKLGHMGDRLSPLDPIFWLHHSMVDRVWAEWQKSGHTTPDPQADYPDQFFEADGKPANASSTGAMNIDGLGYTYDIFQASAQALAGSHLTTQQSSELRKLLPTSVPEIIGSVTPAATVRANLETAFDVAVPRLQGRVGQMRALAATGWTAPGGRLVARLSDVVSPDARGLMVNVFVNCPYLSPTTPYSDPHYAGSFSFFGASKPMPGMPGMAAATYVVDITKAVLESGFSPETIKLQLMPLPAIAGAGSSAAFQVGKVEILAV